MTAPVLQPYTMRRGSLTLAGAGGVPLGQFMQTSGEAPTGWAILSGNTGNALAIDSATGAITPVASGGFGAATWALGIQATGPSGPSNIATLTINTAALTYTVATPADTDTGLRNTSGIKAGLSGKTVEIARGAEAAFAGRTNLNFRGFNTHGATWFTITNEDAAHPTALTLFTGIGLQRCNVLGLAFVTGIPTAYTGSGLDQAATDRQTLQGLQAFNLTYNSTFSFCQDVLVDGLKVGADPSYTDPTQWQTAFNLIGGPAAGQALDRIEVRNCTLARVKDGFLIGNLSNTSIHDNTVNLFCSNAHFLGSAQMSDLQIYNQVATRPSFNPADPGDHQDMFQTGSSGVNSDWARIKIRNNKLLTLDGTALAQGPFCNDVGFNSTGGNTGTVVISNGQRLTGFKFIDCEISGNLYEGGANGLTFDVGTGWLVERNTIIRGKMASVQLKTGYQFADPQVRADLLTETSGAGSVPGRAVVYQGIVRNNVAHAAPVSVSNFALSTNTWVGATGLPTDATATSTPNEASRVAFLSTWFQAPANDDPTIAYRPILNGPLKNADGTYQGALFPDGRTNDGSVYGAPPPSVASKGFLRRFGIRA